MSVESNLVLFEIVRPVNLFDVTRIPTLLRLVEEVLGVRPTDFVIWNKDLRYGSENLIVVVTVYNQNKEGLEESVNV